MLSSIDNVSLFPLLADPTLPLRLFCFISSETFSPNVLTKIVSNSSLETILEIPLIKIIYLIDNKFIDTHRNRKEERKTFSLLINLLEQSDTKTLVKIQAFIVFLMCIKHKLIDLNYFPKANKLLSNAYKKILKVTESYNELDNLGFLEILLLRALKVASTTTIKRTLSTSYLISLLYAVYTEQSIVIPLINIFLIGFIYNKLKQENIESLILKKESLQNEEQLFALLDSFLIELNDKEIIPAPQSMDSSRLQVLEHKNKEGKYFSERDETEEIKSSIPIPSRAKFKRKKSAQKLKSIPIVSSTITVLSFLGGIIVTTFQGVVSLPHKVIRRCKKRNKEDTPLSYSAPPNKKTSFAYYKSIDATEIEDSMMDDKEKKLTQPSNMRAYSQKNVRKKVRKTVTRNSAISAREKLMTSSLTKEHKREIVPDSDATPVIFPPSPVVKVKTSSAPVIATAVSLPSEKMTASIIESIERKESIPPATMAEPVLAEAKNLNSPILALLEALNKTLTIKDLTEELWEVDAHHQAGLKKSILPAYQDTLKVLFGKSTLKAWQALEVCGVLKYLLPDLHGWLGKEHIINSWLQDAFKNLDILAMQHALDMNTHFDEFTSILLTLEMYRSYRRIKNADVSHEEASLLLHLSDAFRSKTAQLLGVTDISLQPRMIMQFRYLIDFLEDIQQKIELNKKTILTTHMHESFASVSPNSESHPMEEFCYSPASSFQSNFSSPGFYTSMGIGDNVGSHLSIASSHLFAYSHVHIAPIPSSCTETLSQDYAAEIGDEKDNAETIKILPRDNKAALSKEAIDYLQSHFLIKTLQVIVSSRYKIYLAGGAVEDILRNKLPRDFDFVTNAPAEFVETHLQWHLSPHKENYFQKKSQGCSADLIAETILEPLVEHSKTRDIASSALFIDLSDLTYILDPTGKGLKSIHLQCVTLVVETEGLKQTEKFECWQKIFREDPMRLLRVAHICAKYNDHLPTDLHALILTQTDCIRELPVGKLRSMIKKSFLQGNAVNHFNYWVALGLFKSLFPDIKKENYLWLQNQLIKQDKDFNLHHNISSFYFLALLILAEDIERKEPLSDEEITTRNMKYILYISGMWPDRENLDSVKKYVQSIEKEILCLSDITLSLSAEENQSLKISGSQFTSWCVFLGQSKEHGVDVRHLSLHSEKAVHPVDHSSRSGKNPS